MGVVYLYSLALFLFVFGNEDVEIKGGESIG